jgi:hypothetical protein
VARLTEKKKGRLPRGLVYRAKNLAKFYLYGLVLWFAAFLITFAGLFHLIDPVQVLSILVAELPLALLVWYLFQRRESGRRTVLDYAELAKLEAQYDHLRIIYHDNWDFADYPDRQYFVLNRKSNPPKAYFLPIYIRELDKGHIIRREKRFKSLEALKEYVDEIGGLLVLDYPEPKDLLGPKSQNDET